MEKFDNKGEVNLIDAIKCPRVLKFLNTKLPKPATKEDINKKTVNFSIKKDNERSEGQGFKITKQASLRKIRSEKVLPAPNDESNNLSKATSRKQIKLPPLEVEDNPSIVIPDNSSVIKESNSVMKTPSSPLSFSQKKVSN